MSKQILCPIDFSEGSKHAIPYAMALARLQDAGITVLHVMPPPSPAERPEDRCGDVGRLRTAAAECFGEASAAGLRVDVIVDEGQAVRQILTRAAALPADTIVMGTHGVGGFEHLMLGSVAETVLRKATCPVLTVPPQATVTPNESFKRIVCAVDFSEWSVAALENACALAEQAHGSVTAVHVIEWPWTEPPSPDSTALPPAQAAALAEYRRYAETMAKSRLDKLVQEIGRDRCRIETRIVHGKSYVQLVCVAERERADAIVIGVHGRSALDVFFFGSTTHQVVRRASCPVLTLRR